MLGSNPSADSAGLDRSKWGCFGIPISLASRGPDRERPQSAKSWRCGGKALRPSLLPLRKPASSHNACVGPFP